MSSKVAGTRVNEISRLANKRCSNWKDDVAAWDQRASDWQMAADISKICEELLSLRERMRQIRNFSAEV